MHPHHLGMHIVIDSELLILNFELNFLCANMFSNEDSKIFSVCPSILLSVATQAKLPSLRQNQSYKK